MRSQKKKGRPPKFVRDRQGKEIYGLSYHKSSGTYYATFNPSTYFGRDFDRAVMLFRQWQASKRNETTKLTIPYYSGLPTGPISWTEELPEPIGKFWSCEEGVYIPVSEGDSITIPPELIWNEAKKIILADPVEASRKLGIPEIAHLRELPPLEPLPNLKKIGEMYFSRRDKDITESELAKSKKFWKEFRRIVGVSEVREIRAKHINQYYEKIYQQYRNGKSTTYVKHRFTKIKTIFRNALKYVDDPREIKDVLVLCARLSPPKQVVQCPEAITREDFHKLLDVSDTTWRAMFLLSLNCAFYMQDVITIPKVAVDLQNRVVKFPRGKTGIMRVATLWGRTVRSIEDYLNIKKHNSDILFLSNLGKPYSRYGAAERFRNIRRKAGIPDKVKFQHIRDGATSAAFSAGGVNNFDTEYLNILLGHQITGQKVKYISLNPKVVEPVCCAIERFYFEDDAEEMRQLQSSGAS